MAKVWLTTLAIAIPLTSGIIFLSTSNWTDFAIRMTAVPLGIWIGFVYLRKTAKWLDMQVRLAFSEVLLQIGFGCILDGTIYRIARVMVTTERVVITSSKCQVVIPLDVSEQG